MAHLETPQIAPWGEANRNKIGVELGRLDRRLAGQTFIAGDRYSIADITTLVAIDFMKPARVAKPENYANIARWYAAVSARPSASA